MGVWRAATAAVLAMSAAACASGPDEDAPADSVSPVVVTTTPEWAFYPQANVEGEMSVSGAGCLLVGDFPVVWPSGTDWDEQAETLTFENDAASVPMGGYFEGAGGSIPLRIWREELEPEMTKALVECLADSGASAAMFAYPEG
jgi:hypothetical protein